MTRIPDRDQESATRWLPRMRCAVHLLIYRLKRDATLDASALFRLHARPLGRTKLSYFVNGVNGFGSSSSGPGFTRGPG
jgi:hypothetical protein